MRDSAYELHEFGVAAAARAIRNGDISSEMYVSTLLERARAQADLNAFITLDEWGYWINFASLGIADTGLIFFVLVPGYAPVWPSILGPIFWVLATIFSTIAPLTRTKGDMQPYGRQYRTYAAAIAAVAEVPFLCSWP